MQNFIKTIINSVQSWTKKQIRQSTADWNENNPNVDSYVKNRTHWVDEVVIVDNLTKNDYLNGECPSCNFVEGDIYKVIYNGKVYDNLVCYFDDDYNVIASSDNGCPFYIDDDGGDNLYIETADDSADWTISIIKETIHQIDKKFVPKLDLSDVAYSGDYHDLNNIDTELSETSNNAVSNSVITAGINEKLRLRDFSLPSNTTWKSVCYGNGTFVSIEGSDNNATNIIAYSKDGMAWEQSSLGEQYFWKAVCYGNGKFVAVGNKLGKKANINKNYFVYAYSTDGILWKVSSYEQTFSPNSLCYGSDRFIAVGELWDRMYTDYLMYSYDGITWSRGSHKVSDHWQSVAYGNGIFVTIPKSGYGGFYSVDGTNWSYVKISDTEESLLQICCGENQFIIIPVQGDYVYHSYDGISWSKVYLPIYMEWSTACYGNDKFVVIGSNSNIAIYSEDGINWIQIELPFSANWSSICYGDGKFVAIADDSDLAIYSTDGITWKNKAILKGNEDVTEDVAMAVKPCLIDTIQSHINAPRFTLTLTDEVNGLDYIVAMQNGNLVTYRPIKSIAVTTMPNKTKYFDNDEFDPDGMVVMATDLDGSTREIYNYSYNSIIHYNNIVSEDGSYKFTITYTEVNNTFETTIDLNVLPFSLVDFEYIENDDGTFMITDWKGTYNGEPSTKIIVPDSEFIIV